MLARCRAAGEPWPWRVAELAQAAGGVGAAALLEDLEADVGGNVVALAGVADGWARQGDVGRAALLGRRIAHAAARLADGDDWAVADAAQAVLRLEHPALADARAALAARIAQTAPTLPFNGRDQVIEALAAVGDHDALAIVEGSLRDGGLDAYAYAALTEGYATIGDGDGAVRCARRAGGSARCVQLLAAAGRLDDARVVAELATSPFDRATRLAHVAAQVLQTGDRAAALAQARAAIRMAESIDDTDVRGWGAGTEMALAAVARALAAAGDVATARACAERARARLERVTRHDSLSLFRARPVFEALLGCGLPEAALTIAEAWNDPRWIAASAAALGRAGDAALALALAERIAAAIEGDDSTFALECAESRLAAAVAFRGAGRDERADDSSRSRCRRRPPPLAIRMRWRWSVVRRLGRSAFPSPRAWSARCATPAGRTPPSTSPVRSPPLRTRERTRSRACSPRPGSTPTPPRMRARRSLTRCFRPSKRR